MDKKQPDLDAQIANQLLYTLPFPAILNDNADKILWCNEAFIQLVKANASDIVEQLKSDVENLYFIGQPDQTEILQILNPGLFQFGVRVNF